jgi:hypothetical protein
MWLVRWHVIGNESSDSYNKLILNLQHQSSSALSLLTWPWFCFFNLSLSALSLLSNHSFRGLNPKWSNFPSISSLNTLHCYERLARYGSVQRMFWYFLSFSNNDLNFKHSLSILQICFFYRFKRCFFKNIWYGNTEYNFVVTKISCQFILCWNNFTMHVKISTVVKPYIYCYYILYKLLNAWLIFFDSLLCFSFNWMYPDTWVSFLFCSYS